MATPTGKRDGNGYLIPIYNYNSITTKATTVVKTGGGFLHSITINTPVATGTIKVVDGVSDTTPVIATITTPASPQLTTLVFDVEFNTGLTIVTGVEAQDITVSYI